MLDHAQPAVALIMLAALVVAGLWIYLVCKLVFLGRPRNVTIRALGVEVTVRAPGVTDGGN